MNIKIQDPPSRTQTFVRNTYYVIRGLAAMTVYFFRTFPFAFFYVLLGVSLALDANNVPLNGLMEPGMLVKLFTYALQTNLLWLAVKVSRAWDKFFRDA
ncbi:MULTISPECIES: hypothetical protein [Klebsiella]|uniref:hypothetical protein n=1 Tax=Klebsiella TaxID=570 RepID=UPI0012B6FEC2|nr:hypothetical protein [Klebsiella grimontii]